MLIAAGAVEQEQRGRPRIGAGFKDVMIGEVSHGSSRHTDGCETMAAMKGCIAQAQAAHPQKLPPAGTGCRGAVLLRPKDGRTTHQGAARLLPDNGYRVIYLFYTPSIFRIRTRCRPPSNSVASQVRVIAIASASLTVR